MAGRDAGSLGLAVLAMFAAFALGAAVGNSERESVERLMGALWDDQSPGLQVTAFEEVHTPPQAPEQVERNVGRVYEAMDRAAGVRKPEEEFEAEVRQEAERIADQQRQGKLYKVRVTRYRGSVRVDRATVRASGSTPETYDETLVNVADDAGGIEKSFRIDHRKKVGTILKGQWSNPHYSDLGSFSEGSRMLLRSFLGRVEKQRDDTILILPEPAKIDACLSSEEGLAKFTFRADELNGRPVQVLSVRLQGQEYPLGRWILDANDYRICYREEILRPSDGSTKVVREASHFVKVDEANRPYPRKVTLTRYGEGGEVTKSKEFAVESVEFSEAIRAEVFAFDVPPDYAIVDYRYPEPVVVQPDRGEARPRVHEAAPLIANQSKLGREALRVEEDAASMDEEGPGREPADTGVGDAATSGDAAHWDMGPAFVTIVRQAITPLCFAIALVLLLKGWPKRLVEDWREKPFYPFRRWTWTKMPENWKKAFVVRLLWALLFCGVAVWLLAYRGLAALGFAGVATLVAANFVVVCVRIVIKRVRLTSAD